MIKDIFKAIDPKEIDKNVFNLIGSDWMLITAGTKESFNMMTASWGMLGILWHRPVATCFVRPPRYTYQFMEKSAFYTLSFFDKKYKDMLNFCGTKSGRNVNKAKETGLMPHETENKSIVFEQASMVIECKKIYYSDINPELFVDKTIHDVYPHKDYHRMYVGEIVNCFVKK